MYDTRALISRPLGFKATAVFHRPRLFRKFIGSCGSGNLEQKSEVQIALQEAEKAVSQADASIHHLSRLPSAYPPHPVVLAMQSMVKPLAVVGSLAVVLYSLNYGSVWSRGSASIVMPTAIAWISLRKGSLSPSGAFAALFVGFGTFLAGFRCVAILLSFFVSSSALTKLKEDKKQAALADHKKGGQRDWIQVLCNGGFATVCCLVYAASTGFRDPPLGMQRVTKLSTFAFGSVLGNYACTCGDTWASELGVLSSAVPRLITAMRPVQRGTNGGVTLLGLAASLGGGLFVGMMGYLGTLLVSVGSSFWPVAVSRWPLIPLGMMGGLIGSIVDSLLGATLQYSGYDMKLKRVVNRPGENPDNIFKISGRDILSNNQVNLLSSLIIAMITGYIMICIYH